MYEGTNPAAKRSQTAIVSALISLLDERPLGKLTVKNIMDNTDLSRQTFYQLFESTDEVLSFQLQYLYQQYQKQVDPQPLNTLCDIGKYFFKFFDNNVDFFELMIKNDQSCLIQANCLKFLKTEQFYDVLNVSAEDPNDEKYVASFISAGIVGVLIEWIHDDRDTESDHLANLVCRMVGAPTQ